MPEKVTPTMIVEIDIIINKLFRFSKCLDLREAFLSLYVFYGSVHSCPFFTYESSASLTLFTNSPTG